MIREPRSTTCRRRMDGRPTSTSGTSIRDWPERLIPDRSNGARAERALAGAANGIMLYFVSFCFYIKKNQTTLGVLLFAIHIPQIWGKHNSLNLHIFPYSSPVIEEEKRRHCSIVVFNPLRQKCKEREKDSMPPACSRQPHWPCRVSLQRQLLFFSAVARPIFHKHTDAYRFCSLEISWSKSSRSSSLILSASDGISVLASSAFSQHRDPTPG